MASTVDFGTDTYCGSSLSTGVLVSGTTALAQAIYRRLITPRGMLRGGTAESDYGIDIVGIIGKVDYDGDAGKTLLGQIRNEVMKDERVADCEVTVLSTTGSDGAISYTITIDVEAIEEGDVTLVLGVDNVSANLLGYTEAT